MMTDKSISNEAPWHRVRPLTAEESHTIDIEVAEHRIAYLNKKIAGGYATWEDRDDLKRTLRLLKKLQKDL